MKYTQEYRGLLKSSLEVELQDTGFNYAFKDQSVFGQPREEELFISYSDITNDKLKKTRPHPYAKDPFKVLIVVVAVIAIVLIAGLFSGPPNDVSYTPLKLTIYALLAAIFIAYRFLVLQKVLIVKQYGGAFFTLFDTKEGEKIREEILKARNVYLRKKYVDGNNWKTMSPESIEYFASLKIITREEAVEFKEKNNSNKEPSVGFQQEKA